MDEQSIALDECHFCGWTDGEHAPGCPYDPDIIDMESATDYEMDSNTSPVTINLTDEIPF